MPQYTDVDIDPVTKQPLQAAAQPQQPQQAAAQPVQQQPGFDVEKFAADSANRQMMFASQRGGRPTQQDFETARQAAYSQGMETMRQMQLDQMRRQGELQKQEQMRYYEQFGPREMTPEEIKDTSGILNSHNQIMMLHHQFQDAAQVPGYSTMGPIGDIAAQVQKMTDPRVRLYEATRGGSIITLGRGLLQDTGQVAGKEQAQDLIKQLMPGPGDSLEMGARKSADMIQMELNGLQSKISGLPSNVDSTPLKNAYANAYKDYSSIVNQYGSDAQKNFPAPSPQQLFGQQIMEQNQQAGQTSAYSTIVQPAVKAGLTPTTNATLNTQVTGGTPQAQAGGTPQAPGQAIPSQFQSSPQPTALGAAAQQAGQYAGGSTVMTPQNMPPVQGAPGGQVLASGDIARGAGQAAQGTGQAVGQGAQATLGWLQSLLPENWAGQTAGQFNR